MLLTMEEIKAQLRLDEDFDADDRHLQLLACAAQKRTETYLNRKLYAPDETIPDSDPDGLHLPDDIRLGDADAYQPFLRKPLVGYGSGETRHAAEFWLACRPVQVLSAMKIRQAQTSATYILPDPGELNKRVLIRQRVDMPADNFGVEPQYPVTFRTWAKVIQTSATTWQETAQTGDAITHYITIRYRRGITADYEVVCDDSVYRVKRQRDLNGARRFLLLECTELGECRQSHGGSNGDSLFSR